MYSNCQLKFLFDFLVPENLDNKLLKKCELILPRVHFSGLRGGLILRTSLQRKKITTICCPIHRNELYTGSLNSVYSLSGTCPQKLSVEWHYLKFFLTQIFLHFGQFYFYSRQVCNKGLANWTAITDTLTLNGFTRNAKHGFNSWQCSNLAWNSVALNYNLFHCSFTLWSCIRLFAKHIGSRSDIGKMTECFWQMCLWKILIFFWEEN